MPHITWLKSLGDASFSIYLFQQFGFEGATRLAVQLTRRTGLDFGAGVIARPLSMTAAIVLGLWLYRVLERPMTRRIRRSLAVGPGLR